MKRRESLLKPTKLTISDGEEFPTQRYAFESVMGTVYIEAVSWEDADEKYEWWVDNNYPDDVRFVPKKKYKTHTKPPKGEVLLSQDEWGDA